MSLFGPPNIEKLKQKHDFKGLIKALEFQKDYYIRRTAAKALGDLGDSCAVEPLLLVMRDREERVRQAAAEALGKLGDARAFQPLVAALKDQDRDVCLAASNALVRFGDAAVESLVAELNDGTPVVRLMAIDALAKIGGARALPSFVTALKDPDKDVRLAASNALVSIGGPAVELLMAESTNTNSVVRQLVIEALAKIGDARAVRSFVAALNDPDREVRLEASGALVKIGAPAIDGLIDTLGDPHEEVRLAAVEVLRQIGAPTVKPLIAASDSPNEFVRQLASEMLEKIRDVKVKPLLEKLRDNDWSARNETAEALGRIGELAIDPLSAELRYGNDNSRLGAVEALGKIGSPRVVEPLCAALSDNRLYIGWAAVRALKNIGDERAIDPLIAAMKEIEYDFSQATMDALVNLGAAAVDPLIAALQHKDPCIRYHAAQVLGRIGDPRAIRPLISGLKDRVARSDAAKALERLNWKPGNDETGAEYWIARKEWDKCVKIGAPAIKPLISLLQEGGAAGNAASEALDRLNWDPGKDENGAVYWLARGNWDKCAEIGAPAAGPLIDKFKDASIEVREEAARVLKQIGKEAVDLLIRALQDEQWLVRDYSARTLGEIGDPRAVDSLTAMLQDPVLQVQQTAAEALAKLGIPASEAGAALQAGSISPTKIEVKKWAGIEFVRVPKGKFLMGSREDNQEAIERDKPQFTLEIPYDYWISRFPITVGQFQDFVRSTSYQTTAEDKGYGTGFDGYQWKFINGVDWRHPISPEIGSSGTNHPVVQVSWEDAIEYCDWLHEKLQGELPQGYYLRLPNEAEWEKAARGEYGNEWSWGNEWDARLCNSKEKGPMRTTPVGAYSPQGDSPFGAADMAGNVFEWCYMLCISYPYPADKIEEGGPLTDVPALRGGSFNYPAGMARCAYRDVDVNEAGTDAWTGFRVVLSI